MYGFVCTISLQTMCKAELHSDFEVDIIIPTSPKFLFFLLNCCADNCHHLENMGGLLPVLIQWKTLGFAALGLCWGEIMFGSFSIIHHTIVSKVLSWSKTMSIISGVDFALDSLFWSAYCLCSWSSERNGLRSHNLWEVMWYLWSQTPRWTCIWDCASSNLM